MASAPIRATAAVWGAGVGSAWDVCRWNEVCRLFREQPVGLEELERLGSRKYTNEIFSKSDTICQAFS